MLVHLKHQKPLPTVLLAAFYLILNTVLSAIVLAVLFSVFILIARIFFISRYREILGMFYMMRYFLGFAFVMGTSLFLFKFSNNIQKKFFKKYPLTPLFMITFAVFGSLLGLIWTILSAFTR